MTNTNEVHPNDLDWDEPDLPGEVADSEPCDCDETCSDLCSCDCHSTDEWYPDRTYRAGYDYACGYYD